ncbi:MAG: CRISPR-associated endonuclease Cas1 [Thauera sp.]|jgi:hypothetical protein|nr:CRISPR-associated endonuclease Cas1 [Thauera sp.]
MVSIAQRYATAAIPSKKPLYIMNQAPAHMEAGRDYLMLKRPAANPQRIDKQRFPIARIARILCNRQLNWSGQALALCMTEGVPITWVDGHGHALGNTQPRQTQSLPFSTLIETYLELADWQRRFSNWLARRRLETLTTCAQRAAETGHGLSSNEFHELKREYVYNGFHPVIFCVDAQAWTHGLAVDRLQREGLHSHYWGFNASKLDLAAELATLLWAELNLDCGHLANTESGIVAARLFEAWANRHENRLLLHLGDLKRHLAREVEAWH